MNLSSASHHRGGRCSVGLPTLCLDWEANDFFHLLSGLRDPALRITEYTHSRRPRQGQPEPALRLHRRLGDRRVNTASPHTLPVTSSTGASPPSPSHLDTISLLHASHHLKSMYSGLKLNNPFVPSSAAIATAGRQ